MQSTHNKGRVQICKIVFAAFICTLQHSFVLPREEIFIFDGCHSAAKLTRSLMNEADARATMLAASALEARGVVATQQSSKPLASRCYHIMMTAGTMLVS